MVGKSDGGCKIGRIMRLVSGDFRIFLGILGRLKRSREDCGWKKWWWVQDCPSDEASERGLAPDGPTRGKWHRHKINNSRISRDIICPDSDLKLFLLISSLLQGKLLSCMFHKRNSSIHFLFFSSLINYFTYMIYWYSARSWNVLKGYKFPSLLENSFLYHPCQPLLLQK